MPPQETAPPSPEAAANKRLQWTRLLKLARPEWRRLTAGTFFLLVGSSMSLAYPQAVRFIVDEALTRADLDAIDSAVLIMVGIFSVQGAAVALRYYLFTWAGERIVARLRRHLFRAIIDQEIAFFDTRRTGELTSRLSADTALLQNAAGVNISMALRNVVQTIGGIALLAYTSPQLTAIMLSIVPPLVIGAALTGRVVRRSSRRVQDALAKAAEVAEESIAGIRTVRAFSREPYESSRYSDRIDVALGHTRDRMRLVAVFQGLVTTASFGALAVILWYGGRLVVAGSLSVGALTSFLLYTLTVAFALGTLSSLWTQFMAALGASDRVFEVLERVPAIPQQGGRQVENISGSVTFRDVTFSYPARPDIPVLQALNFTIAPGEKVALVGPSGAGKSTIAALISRFYDPSEGTIEIGGHPLTELEPASVRGQIATVAQEPTLFSDTIAANILYGGLHEPHEVTAATVRELDAVTLNLVTEAASAANAAQFIESFPDAYDTMVGERGVQLSGGQRQRIAIARALLRDPRLLILDEATSALDAESEFLVQEALERLMESRTTLIIAHRLSTVVSADRVVVLVDGAVVQDGSHTELMKSEDGLYRRLVRRQFAQADDMDGTDTR